jgi:hypothetical protein
MTSVEQTWWRVDPRALAALRTGVGLAAFGKAAILYATAPGLVKAEPPLPALGELSLRAVLPANVVPALLLGLAVFGLLLVLGPQARISAGVVAVLSTGLLLFEGRLWSNHLLLLAVLAALTATTGAGAWRNVHRRGASPSRPEGLVRSPAAILVCTQVAIVYLFAGVSKLTLGFLDGSVLAVQLAAGPAAGLLGEAPQGLLVALSIATVAVEIALAVVLWLPRTRKLGAVLGVGLHIGILATVAPWPDLIVFSLLMLGAYPLFLTRGPLRRTGRVRPRVRRGVRPAVAA